jgi:malate synthase
MEDMATGEIRLSILWEWLHKKASLMEAKRRIRLLAEAFRKDGTRITENLDFTGVSTQAAPRQALTSSRARGT